MKRIDRWFESLRVFRRFSGHLRPHRLPLAGVCGLMLMTVGIDLARPWTVRWVIDYGLIRKTPLEHEPFFYVWTGAAAYLLISAVRSGVEYAATLITARVGHSVTRSIRNAIFGHLCRLSPAFHARNKSGDLLVRSVGDVTITRTMLVESSVALLTRALLIVLTIVTLFRIDALTTGVVLGLIPIVVLVIRALSRQLTIAVRKQRQKEGQMADFLHEALAAAPLIQSLGREEDTARHFARSSRTEARAGLKTARLAARMSASVESLLALATAVALGLGGWRVLSTDSFTVGELTVVLSYIRSLLKPIRAAAKHSDKIAKGTACGERILRVLDTPIEIETRAGALPAPEKPRVLAYEDVEFVYPDGQLALSGISTRFEQGRMTAVFGRSGAGKSTLAALAVRLFDPTSGRVTLDGVDLRDYDLASLRERVGLGMQETVLFGDTIRENLLLGRPEATDEELHDACRAAAVDGLIDSLPEGLDTELGSGGVGASGGERRRLCLARTFLRSAPLVIVDEPYAGLDRETAARVRASLRSFARDRIVIVITHDVEHLGEFDRILFLEDGCLVAEGGHEELFRNVETYRRITHAASAVAG